MISQWVWVWVYGMLFGVGSPLSSPEYSFLLDFYNATGGPSWYNHRQWLEGNPCNPPWFGVACDQTQTHINQLLFPSNNLIGTIPDSIGSLVALSDLYFQSNLLNGTLPQTLFSISTLQTLEFSNNQFSGTLPSMENLTSLAALALNQNDLEGTIPTSIGMATSLYSVDISCNKLSGSIPTEIGLLEMMKLIDFSNNMLSGPIPDQIGSLTSLTGLKLLNNDLVSTIPSSISNLISLNTLALAYNKLNGTLPDLSTMKSLQQLVICENELSGTLPSLQGLKGLNTMDISTNHFHGQIPSSIGSLSTLIILNMGKNNFTGEIPHSIGNLTYLLTLDLSLNQLTGALPSTFNNLTKVITIILRSNLLTDITGICVNQHTLQTLDVTNNLLTFIPWRDISNCNSLTTLYLAQNKLKTVFIPEKCYLSVFDLTDNEIDQLLFFDDTSTVFISSLSLNNNYLNMTTAQISNFISFRAPLLTYLDLSNNFISGQLKDLYFYNSLTTLILNQNLISGDLTFFDNHGLPFQFLILGLSGNKISGRISNQIIKLSYYTKELYLDNNNLTGELPPNLPPSIEVINLHNNKLVGTIPNSWGQLKRLRQINLEGNSICGCVPALWNQHNWISCNLNGLKFSCECEIPRACAELLQCDASVVDSECGVNQCNSSHLCQSPRKCIPKGNNGYYYGYQCTDCKGIYENADPFTCKPTLVIILTPPIAGLFIILLIILIVIARKCFSHRQVILLPHSWFWDIERIKRKNYFKSTQEPHYYYKKLTDETIKENEFFLMLIDKLDFKDFEVKSCYAIVSPILAHSASNTLQIQMSRLNSDKTTFFSQNWKYSDEAKRRENLINHFVSKCLEWEWNKDKSIDNCFILPVVHGTSTEFAWKIASSGFASLSVLDQGYYGKGIYFTTSALYTVQYLSNKKKPAILICFAIPGNPFPVVENPLNSTSFLGKHLVERYQSHYCITNATGLPYTEEDEQNGSSKFDELVIDQESQIVPLFLVKVEFSEEVVKAYTRALPIQESGYVSRSHLIKRHNLDRQEEETESQPLLIKRFKSTRPLSDFSQVNTQIN